MPWHFTADAAHYALRAEPWLLRDPVRNNVLLTVIEHARQGTASWSADAALYAWHETDDGAVDAAASHTPPHKLLLPDLSTSLTAALAHALCARRHALPGLRGPIPTADAFVAAWCARAGVTARVDMRERMYQLAAVAPASRSAPGHLRPALDADVPLVTRWIEDFTLEAGVEPTDYARWARTRLPALRLWERDDATPVTLVGNAPPVGGVARIGPVWTPPEHRRRGYATAAVAARSRELLAAGARACALYTDLANPTSNSIYQAIGYRPVTDVIAYAFAP